MDFLAKRGVALIFVAGIFCLFGFFAFVNAAIVTEEFEFTSAGCDAGSYRFVPKVISIIPETYVNVSVPKILMNDGVLAYSGLKTDDFLIANGASVSIGLTCTSPPWTENSASQCYLNVTQPKVNFTGIDHSFGGIPGNRCFAANSISSNGSVIYTPSSGCTPKTCSELGKQCGNWSDGCGGEVTCVTCGLGKACNLTGQCIQRYFFGGTYSYKSQANDDYYYDNPLTGGQNCTENYIATKVWGSKNCYSENDANLFFCWANASNASISRVSIFGGMYGHLGSTPVNNVLTDAQSCLGGYETHKFTGRGSGDLCNVGVRYPGDREAFFCHNESNLNSGDAILFGGMYGYHEDGAYINPITGAASCPVGYESQQLLRESDKDRSLFYCYARVSACTPQCTGKQCGDNGCGETCGTCDPGFDCNSTGQCVAGGGGGGSGLDIIMRLSANTGALGGRYDSIYPILINYTEIFRKIYLGANPHECTGSNFVVSLTEQGLARTSPAVKVCTPKTCAQIGKSCGVWYDGCNGTIDCTSCASGEFCNGTSGACQVRTGIAPQCSSWTLPECVGGKIVANGVDSEGCANPSVCVQGEFCIPKTCAQIGKSCGSWNDGCGSSLQCGSCDSGEFCNGTSGACQVRTGIAPQCSSWTLPECVGGKIVANGVDSEGCANPMMCAKIYNVSICYGDVDCTAKTVCSEGEIEILGMSAQNDALLALPGTAVYPYRICCKRAVIPTSNYYWANNNGGEITSAVERDQVTLVAKTGLGGNVLVNFSIYEDDFIDDDTIHEGLEVLTDSDGIATFNWTITREDMDEAHIGTYEGTLWEGVYGEFYFVAEYMNNTEEVTGESGILEARLINITEQCMVTFIDPADDEERLITYCDDYNFIPDANNETKAVQCAQDCNDVKENEKDLIDEGAITNYGCEWVDNSEGCKFTFDWSGCTPNCAGKSCGDDNGCGGKCTGCPSGETCDATTWTCRGGGGGGGGGFVPGVCQAFTTQGPCGADGFRDITTVYKQRKSNGQKFYTFEEINDPSICPNKCGMQWGCPTPTQKTDRVICQTAIQETLSFFSVFNLVAAMSIIALVYVALLFRRELKR